MPTTANHKNTISRINFRLPSDVKEKIERAAAASGLNVTEFAVHALTNTADEILERQHARRLTDRDRDTFLAMLDADDEPNDALKDAFSAHRELIGK